MSTQPVLGKLWISLCPTNGKIRTTGGRPKYQQQVIFRLIEEFGFNTVVHIQPPPQENWGACRLYKKGWNSACFWATTSVI
jgi:hypothetical protein